MPSMQTYDQAPLTTVGSSDGAAAVVCLHPVTTLPCSNAINTADLRAAVKWCLQSAVIDASKEFKCSACVPTDNRLKERTALEKRMAADTDNGSPDAIVKGSGKSQQ